MSNAWIDQQQRRQEWPLLYREGRDLPASPEYPHHRIVVDAGLYRIGDQVPYFSVTCDIINKRKSGDNAHEGGGAAHELIAEHFPELAPVIALHLSDENGAPLHAAANGAYWLGLTEYKRAKVRRSPNEGLTPADLPYLPYVASHFRVTEAEAADLAERLQTSEDVAAYVESQRDRWAAEALEAVTLLLSLGATDYTGSLPG